MLTAKTEFRIQAFELRCYRRLLRISYREHKANEWVRETVTAAIGNHEQLL